MTGATDRLVSNFGEFGAETIVVEVDLKMPIDHQGYKVLAFSIVTDMGLPNNMHPVLIEEVIATAGEAEPKLRDLIAGCVGRM